MANFLSFRSSVGALAAVACAAVALVGLQARVFDVHRNTIGITALASIAVLVVLGVLAYRRAGIAAGGILEDAERDVGRLEAQVQRTAYALHAVTRAAERLRNECDQLRSGNHEHASAIAGAATSMTRLTETIGGTSGQAQRVTQVTAEAETKAAEGAEVLTTAIAAMDEIADSGRRINDVVAIIDAIAFQTNLLALNAAVEAARAGNAGKGFAVVATEVRQLAQRAAEAAKEIRQLIRLSGEAVRQGEDLVARTGESFSEVRGAILKVGEMVTSIANACDAQLMEIEKVYAAIEQIDRSTRDQARLAERAADSASALAQEAQALSEHAEDMGGIPLEEASRENLASRGYLPPA